MVVIDQAKDAPWEIVGVVGDVKQNRLREEASLRGTFYRAYAQQPVPTMRLAIRTGGNPLAIVGTLRALLEKIDPDIPLAGPRTMEEIMANGAISETAQAACLAAFSVLAPDLGRGRSLRIAGLCRDPENGRVRYPSRTGCAARRDSDIRTSGRPENHTPGDRPGHGRRGSW